MSLPLNNQFYVTTKVGSTSTSFQSTLSPLFQSTVTVCHHHLKVNSMSPPLVNFMPQSFDSHLCHHCNTVSSMSQSLQSTLCHHHLKVNSMSPLLVNFMPPSFDSHLCHHCDTVSSMSESLHSQLYVTIISQSTLCCHHLKINSTSPSSVNSSVAFS